MIMGPGSINPDPFSVSMNIVRDFSEQIQVQSSQV